MRVYFLYFSTGHAMPRCFNIYTPTIYPHTHTPLLTPTLLFTHYPVWGTNSIPETQIGFSYKSLLCQVNC